MRRRFTVLSCFSVGKQKGLIVADFLENDLFRLYGDTELGFSDALVWIQRKGRFLRAFDEIEVDTVEEITPDPLVPERILVESSTSIKYLRSRSLKTCSKALENIAFRYRFTWLTSSDTKYVPQGGLTPTEAMYSTISLLECGTVEHAVEKNSRGILRPRVSFSHKSNQYKLPYLGETELEPAMVKAGTTYVILGLGEPFWNGRYKLVYGVIADTQREFIEPTLERNWSAHF
jgi:hypothetical protein